MTSKLKKMRQDTVIAHAGRDPSANHGVVNPPVYHASTITFPTIADWEERDKTRMAQRPMDAVVRQHNLRSRKQRRPCTKVTKASRSHLVSVLLRVQ